MSTCGTASEVPEKVARVYCKTGASGSRGRVGPRGLTGPTGPPGPWTLPPPATMTSVGNPGDESYDSDWYYVCVATNSWRRTLLSGW